MSTVPRSFESAREMAMEMARAELRTLQTHDLSDPLDSFHMEAEGCWIFFLNEQIPLANKPGELLFTSYAIAKFINMSALVYDFRPDLDSMQSYLEAWSLYALGRKQEAKAAMEAFHVKFPSAH